jgi:hypothetical protein
MWKVEYKKQLLRELDARLVLFEFKNYDVAALEPQVAVPHNVDNVVPVGEVAGTTINQVFIGSCTNGHLDDLRVAAKILKGKKVASSIRLIVIPATQEIYRQALKEGLIEIFLSAGAVVSTPTCGPRARRWRTQCVERRRHGRAAPTRMIAKWSARPRGSRPASRPRAPETQPVDPRRARRRGCRLDDERRKPQARPQPRVSYALGEPGQSVCELFIYLQPVAYFCLKAVVELDGRERHLFAALGNLIQVLDEILFVEPRRKIVPRAPARGHLVRHARVHFPGDGPVKDGYDPHNNYGKWTIYPNGRLVSADGQQWNIALIG